MADCLSIEELAGVLDLPETDRRRRHLESCPRCASLLASMQAFTDLEDLPAAANLRDADARLDAARKSGIVEAGPTPPTAGKERPAAGIGGRWSRILNSMQGGRLQPALAAAGVLLIALGVWQILDRPDTVGSGRVLRGGPNNLATGPKLAAVELDAQERLRFAWRPFAGAISYHVTFYGPDLEDLQQFEVKADTILLLPVTELLPLARQHRVLFWGVSAWRGRDEMGRSELRQLNIPE